MRIDLFRYRIKSYNHLLQPRHTISQIKVLHAFIRHKRQHEVDSKGDEPPPARHINELGGLLEIIVIRANDFVLMCRVGRSFLLYWVRGPPIQDLYPIILN